MAAATEVFELYRADNTAIVITSMTVTKNSAQGTAAWYNVTNDADPTTAQAEEVGNYTATNQVQPAQLINFSNPVYVARSNRVSVSIRGAIANNINYSVIYRYYEVA